MKAPTFSWAHCRKVRARSTWRLWLASGSSSAPGPTTEDKYITADWTEREGLEFARLMLEYVDSQNALRHRAPDKDASR
ncbi:hypothetical protein GCM10010193_08530 [Kitasatospora atroaurantiaca]